MKTLENRLLQTGMQTGHYVLANKQHSDTKFEFDLISSRKRLLKKVSKSLAALIVAQHEFHDIDAVLTVGNGANPLAWPLSRYISNNLDRPVKPMQSTYKLTRDGSKQFRIL